MALRIVTADERLSAARAKTTMAIFGPSGVGKTSLVEDAAGCRDTLHRSRSRHEVGSGLAGRQHSRSAPLRTRSTSAASSAGSVRPPIQPASSRRGTISISARPIPTWSA